MKFAMLVVIATLALAQFAQAQSDETTSIQDRSFDTTAEKLPVVSGTIDHKRGEPHTHPGPFVFTKDSEAVIEVRACLGEDAPCSLVTTHTITGIYRFPFTYEVKSAYAERCNREGFTCTVGVEVISDGGDEVKVGDLVNEYRIDIAPPVTGLAIEVTGLESCSAPSAGGFCTGQ